MQKMLEETLCRSRFAESKEARLTS